MNNPSYKVMVAEDESLVLRSFCNNLESTNLGFHVVATATNGAEMLPLLAENVPDVLFTDIQMPMMNGLEMLDKINDLYPNMIRVIISGFDDFNYVRDALRLHAEDYLLKPVLKSDIIEILTKIKDKYLTDPEEEPATDKGHPTISQAIATLKQYVLDNYATDVDVTAYAERLHYNELHLCRTFKQVYGMSPQKLITNLRMEDAKKLLLQQNNLTVGEIGIKVGYSSPMYFSRAFKTYTGKTPGEYRAYESEQCNSDI